MVTLVLNPENIKKPIFVCNKLTSDWLQRNGVALYGMFLDKYIFLDNEEFRKVFNKMPLIHKLFGSFQNEERWNKSSRNSS